MSNVIKLKGRYRLIHRRGQKVYGVQWGSNLVVDAGKSLVAEILENNSGTPASPSHIALGSSGVAVDAAQTALQGTEHHRDSATLSRTDNVLSLDATISHSASDVTVEEAGIFNDASAGTMLARWLVQSFTFSNGDSVDITWALTVG